MSRSYTVKGSYASQGAANPRRRLNDEGVLSRDSRSRDEEPAQDQSSQPDQNNATGNERYQRREAYTVIAPKEEKRQHLLRIHQEDEETVRRRQEEKAKTPIKMIPQPVGGPKVSRSELIEHLQKTADKTPTARAIEMREKREKWKRENREREEKEIETKKAAARKQAENNERKQALQKETVRRHWDEKFSNHSSVSSENSSVRQDRDVSHETSGWRSFPSQDYGQGATGWREEGKDLGGELVQLCKMFPDYDPTMLFDLLQEQGSVDRVVMMLEG